MTEQPPESNASAKPAPKSTWRGIWENVQILLIALILALLIRSFVAEPRYIPSDSMVPTLLVNDRLVVEKISYRLRPPEYGDIVVFEPPQALQERFKVAKDQAFIKRVIGTPGQTIEVRENAVFVNGKPLNEPYIAEPPSYRMLPVQVPPDSIFVMGDNRNNSNDSHVWGFLPQKNIIGRAWFRFFPFNRMGVIEPPRNTN